MSLHSASGNSAPGKIFRPFGEDSRRGCKDTRWWSKVQPPRGFEKQIDSILPTTESWSDNMRMWGHKGGDDAYVLYVDDDLSEVEEIAFRIDARSISQDLVQCICLLAKELGAVFLTRNYEIVPADELMVMNAIERSTAKRFVDDPEAALKSMDCPMVEVWLPKESDEPSPGE